MSLNSVRVTQDGSLTLFDQALGQAYHSDLGAFSEAKTLYIERSGFVSKIKNKAQVSVLDVGLGLGYNALSTIEVCESSLVPLKLFLTSLESNDELYKSFQSGEASWQASWSASWKQWARGSGVEEWDVRIGRAQDTILVPPKVPYDFIWQDPFSPDKNPDLWTPEWFATLKQHSSKDCTLMTYSVCRPVKDALTEAGWRWCKIPGMGTKREWLMATPSERAFLQK